ncbi:hypothetical protein GKQ77_22215 [Streptomyces sp. BG9H]|uniref:Integral membrane protein n=1 Tax=Streptomyces anatolicus TaxID=2675858 RepID=A0ABS6YS26_9ACTN|nr:DUF6332 family protein [Streptomyces anatolicus]MBW5424248.1 hypothetical protein [Streptomyces anatolicus]
MAATGYSGRRSAAERDAITIEIGYALVSGAVVALAFIGVVIAGPLLAFDPPPAVVGVLKVAGVALASVAFAVRVATVLWKFHSRSAHPAQPSQPGRTRPDS